MRKRNNLIILTILISILIISMTIYNNCTQTNPLSGGGKDPDLLDPTITIDTPKNNNTVSGVININGTYTDDKTINSIEVFRITGTTMNKIGNATFSINPRTWNYSLDTTAFTNGSNIFKFKITDKAGKTGYQSITLIIDNDGPYLSLTTPDGSLLLAYYRPFETSIIVADPSDINYLEWEITSDDDPTATISGNLTDTITEIYNFTIDPTPLQGKGTISFSKGICTLRVRVRDSQNLYSDWTLDRAKKKMLIDFTKARPVVNIEVPTAQTEGEAQTYGSDVTIAGSATDDVGVSRIKIWYKKTTDPDSSAITIEIPTDGPYTSPAKYQAYSYKLESLTAGTYLVKVDAQDTDNNWAGYSDPRYFIVNTNFPVITFTSPSFGTWQKGNINILGTITSSGGTISNVEYKINESGTYQSIANPNTSTYNLNRTYDTTSYTGGELRYYIRATDNFGNRSEDYLLLYIDNTSPIVSITNPPKINSNLNGNITITGNASDMINATLTGVVNTLTLNIPGIGNVTPIGIAEWSYQFDSTTVVPISGSLLATITASDMAGNTAQDTITLNIDQSADIPLISVSNLVSGQKIYGFYTIAGTASDDDAVLKVEVRIDSGSWVLATGTTSWSYKLDTSQYSNGAHTFYCRSYDIYSKVSSVVSIPFIIDPDLPVITFTSHSENDAIKSNTVVSGTVTKSGGTVSAIEIKLQGTNYTQDWTTTGLTVTGLNTANATFSYTVSTATYGEGPISISLRARDDANKQNSVTLNLVIDTQRPTGVLTLPTSGSIYTSSVLNLAGACSDPSPSSGLFATNIWVKFTNQSTSEQIWVIDGTTGKQINGAVSNWTYSWNIPSNVKDGLYTAELILSDRAGNTPSSAITVTNIRLARYTPTISNLFINSIPVTNNMFVTRTVSFTGDITDNDANDSERGIYKIEIYLSDDNVIGTGDNLLTSQTWGTYPTSTSFTLNYTFTQQKNYIIYRAIDKTAGWTDYPYLVNIDYTPPTQSFKYTSRDYSPSYQTSNPGYSALYWIKLDAADDNDMTGATVQTKLGTTSGGEEIVALQTYTMGDYMKTDLKTYTNSTIYLWYKIKDKAGNETTSVISLSRDSNLPTITSSVLSGGYIRQSTLNVTGTATGGGATVSTIKFSSVDGDLITAYSATGTTSWSYSIPEPTEGDHYIYGVVTANDGTNWYEQFNFTYDKTAPTTTFNVIEITGGRVRTNNLSGTVRFYGTYSDNFGSRYNNTDFTITLNLDGTNQTVPSSNITKNPDGTFDWYYDWNTQTHPNVVKNNITLTVTATDKAGNQLTPKKLDSDATTTQRNITPYITEITTVTGKTAAAYGYNSGSGSWENLNDNQTYTYRLSSGNIEIKGYNLNATGTETITFTKNNGTPTTNTWSGGTGFTENMNTISNLNLTWDANQLTTGTLKITVGGITSNEKIMHVIKNYSAPSGFTQIAETDMVMGDDNLARVIVQKHFQNAGTANVTRSDLGSSQTVSVNFNGSGLFRLIETAEGTWGDSTLDTNEFIHHGYNRYWFVTVTRDIGTASQTDGKYYLLTCDSENDQSNTRGLYLSGRSTFWSTLPNIFRINNHEPIWVPMHDWNFSYNYGTGWTAPSAYYQYLNRWRMSAANGYNDVTNLNDWSVTWGDMIAKNDTVYTVWYSQSDDRMHYRRLNNLGSNSTKSPAGTSGDASINFGISGKYPTITLDTSNRPVIICFDQTNSRVVVYAANNTDPQSVSDFTSYVIESKVCVYPDITIDSSGGIHVVYHDVAAAQLKYAYATSYANLASNIIVLDNDAVAGYYSDITIMPNGKPSVTYMAYGYLGTGDAIRTVRFTDSGTSYTDRTKWIRLTLPCANNITENKVRGYYYTESGLNKLLGFAKSAGPEFFREKP